VYARTKYVLLDDPLSAVDSHTARFLFDRLLCGPLLHDRTVILVTHHVELVLPAAKYVVRMLDGRIDTHGTPFELRKRGVLDNIAHSETAEHQHQQEATLAEEPTVESAAAGGVAAAEAEQVKKEKQAKKLIEDEHREEGAVKWSIYNTYLKASSYWTWIIVLGFILIGEVLNIGERLWIRVRL
jgi:ABC-type multidrug transport system ATPase subunit